MSGREWTPDMGEISGFGGGYEEACRTMLLAGLEWFDRHPDAEVGFQEYEGVYGVISPRTEDAEAFRDHIVGAVGDCTGAMVHAVTGHCLWIRDHSYEEYQERMRARERDE